MTEPTSSIHTVEKPRGAIEGAEHFLVMRNVNVALGDRIVLHDIHLTIRAGEHLAILGPNGCGKSTLIRTMNCELYPWIPSADSGLAHPEISIFGRPRWDLTQLRQHFGVVSDSLPGLQSFSRTAADSAGSTTARTIGQDAVIAGFFSASTLWPNLVVTDDMRTRATQALARIGAAHLAHQPIGEMSAGEKRRILIARALVHRPRQLLLDEPSNALDLAAQRSLRETMRTLMHPDEQGHSTGLILVTHHLADIPPEIDRILLMRNGRIHADGPREELLTPKVLSELFGTEIRIGQDEHWLHSW